MSFWSSLKNAVKKAVKTVVRTIKKAIEVVASTVVGIARTFVHVLINMALTGWYWIKGDKMAARRAFDRMYCAAKKLWKRVVLGPIGAAASLVVTAVSGLQELFYLQPEPLPLTDLQKIVLRMVFNDSINVDKIEVVFTTLLLDGGTWGARSAPYTIGHTIYFPTSAKGKYSLSNQTLVHESVHVWQFENGGPSYTVESVWVQATGKAGAVTTTPGYDFDNALAAGKTWCDLNPEQQAKLIDYAYGYPPGIDPPATFPVANQFQVPLGGPDYIAIFLDAIEMLRSRQGAA